jgi:hypothetical protein
MTSTTFQPSSTASLVDNALPCSTMAIRSSAPKKRWTIQDRALRIMRF